MSSWRPADSLTPGEFAQLQFHRSPTWRYERAQSILQRQIPRIRIEDEDRATLELVEFLRAERKLRRGTLPEFEISRRLMSRWPAITAAHEFRTQPAGSLPRISLEAHLLSGMPLDEISQRFRRPQRVIELYSELYFDVLDRLDMVDYVAGFVIGPVFQAGIEAINADLTAKYFGYFGGPVVLDCVLYGLQRSTALQSSDEVVGFLENAFHRNFKLQAALTATMMQPSRFDLRTLTEGYQAIVTLERAAQQGNQENSWMEQTIRTLMAINQVPRSRDERSGFRTAINSPPLDTPLEPRITDRYALARGELSRVEMEQKLRAFEAPAETGERIMKFEEQ